MNTFSGQTIFDLVVQNYGTLESIGDFLLKNPISLVSKIEPNIPYLLPESLKTDTTITGILGLVVSTPQFETIRGKRLKTEIDEFLITESGNYITTE